MYLEIEKIRRDGGTQPRVGIIKETCEEYALAMAEGDEFPPVVVYHDGSDYWLADGFHRVIAADAAGLDEIAADVKQGTLRDAVLFSVGANATHGERRTNQDKRAAVRRLLEDEEWSQWSDREIARRCKVDNAFASKMRKEALPSVDRQQMDRIRKVTRNGTTYTQNTTKIGAKPGYERNETGGVTKQGFVPEEPDKVYRSPEGEILHHPWSEDRRAADKRKMNFLLDCQDHFKWILGLTALQFEEDLYPMHRDEVGGLLAKATAHLCTLQQERKENGT